MSNPHLICANLHKQRDPSDPRTVEQLEAYYLGLSLGSVFAPLVMQIKAEEIASDALMDTKRIINNAKRI